MADLKKYAEGILTAEDRPLFEDALSSAQAGASRAAYVMIWLACAESLKRRFREAQKRDGSAGKIVGQIEAMEKEYRSVDRYILEKAHEYGFLSASGYTVLCHVYEMRCIYGHPYEEAPSDEQLSHAAASVVEHVLSQPVKLRHGFCEQLLKKMLEDRSYLDDQMVAVASLAGDVIPRIDDGIYGWLLEKYWSELESLADDSSLGAFFRRGVWFTRSLLDSEGVDIFTKDDWHEHISRFPKTLLRVLSQAELFDGIGRRAQDCLVGAVLAEADTRPSVLMELERLNDADVLSERQQKRFLEHVVAMRSTSLRSSGLCTATCFNGVISALRSHDWYNQNPAVDLVVANGPDQAADLEAEQQVELGRNLLQSAQGDARSSKRFLAALADDGTSWPLHVVRGIAIECFANESNEIRFKDGHLEKVLSALNDLKAADRREIIEEIMGSVSSGTPKAWVDRDDFLDAVELAKKRGWAAKLAKCLLAKAGECFPEDDNES